MPFGRLYRGYVALLHKHPLRTKATAAGVIFSSSDVVTQWLEARFSGADEPSASSWYDPNRTFRMTAFGVVSTSYIHFWYGILDGNVERIMSAYGKGVRTFVKVTVDQSTNSVLFNALFFWMTSRLEGNSSEDSVERVKQRLWPQMLMHWPFWWPYHFTNFYFVPLHQRILVQNFGMVFWSGFMSNVGNRKTEEANPASTGQ
jgi:hypothetical protein